MNRKDAIKMNKKFEKDKLNISSNYSNKIISRSNIGASPSQTGGVEPRPGTAPNYVPPVPKRNTLQVKRHLGGVEPRPGTTPKHFPPVPKSNTLQVKRHLGGVEPRSGITPNYVSPIISVPKSSNAAQVNRPSKSFSKQIKLSLITLLSIGSISAASFLVFLALPLVSGGNSETKPPIQDLKEITGITSIEFPAGLTRAELQVTPITLSTTTKIFDGIDETNYKQFNISISGSNNNTKMNLVSKEGYVFSNNKTILRSNAFNIQEEITGITPIESPAGLTRAKLEEYPISLSTTTKIFNGINPTNYKQFEISISGSNNNTTMNLASKEGYVFSNNKTNLKSNEFKIVEEITGINVLTSVIEDLTHAELQATPIAIETAQKVFNGINPTNYGQFDISISWSNSLVTMDLTAKEGFIFPNNQNILKSNEFAYPKPPTPPPLLTNHSFQTVNGINIITKADGTASIVASYATYMNNSLVIEDSYVSQNDSNRYTITSIGNDAFRDSQFFSLDLSKNTSLTSIGNSAFSNSTLTSLDLSKNTSLTSIGDSAFLNTKLWSLDLTQNNLLTSIGNDAFRDSQLFFLDVPTSLKSIGAGAFRNNRLLELDLTKSRWLESIGARAFSGSAFEWSKLHTLKLPNSLTQIGDLAFNNNNWIWEDNLILPKNNSFANNDLFHDERSLKRVGIGIEFIGHYRFNCHACGNTYTRQSKRWQCTGIYTSGAGDRICYTWNDTVTPPRPDLIVTPPRPDLTVTPPRPDLIVTPPRKTEHKE